MAYFDNKTSLVQLNPFLDLSFTHICTAIFDYHITNIFPTNIILMVLDDNQEGNNFLENVAECKKMPLLKDYVYFVSCGLETRFDITPGITTLALHFNLTFFHGIDIFSGTKHCEMDYDPNFTASIRSIVNEEKDELKAACALKAETMRFCLPFWPKDVALKLPVIQKYEPIFRFVRKHGNAELTVRALAEQTGQRQDVFSRAFSRDLGQSPKKFIQDDLVRKISVCLLSPQASVKQAAEELKFSSEFYMSHFFKRHTGLSPREYQAKFRK